MSLAWDKKRNASQKLPNLIISIRSVLSWVYLTIDSQYLPMAATFIPFQITVLSSKQVLRSPSWFYLLRIYSWTYEAAEISNVVFCGVGLGGAELIYIKKKIASNLFQEKHFVIIPDI